MPKKKNVKKKKNNATKTSASRLRSSLVRIETSLLPSFKCEAVLQRTAAIQDRNGLQRKKRCYTPTHTRGRPLGCSYGRKNGRCLSKRAFESRVEAAKKRFSKARIATRLQTSFRTRRNSPNNSSSAIRIQSAMRRLSAKKKRSEAKDSLPFYPQIKTAIGKASNGTKFRTPHGIYMKVPKSVNSKGYNKLTK